MIGLAGGIGAGKSRVAAELAALGCLVVDSDKEARAALDRPEVRAELTRWWGDGIVGADGRVDRGAIAKIVFASPGERERLEELVHPLVRRTRAEMIARSDPRTTRGVIVDAPLLYEVGLDKECDAVIFVDAPRAQRVSRVRANRGWSEAELEKRENAQLPLEEKRRRADEIVVNDAGDAELRERVRAALERIQERFADGFPARRARHA